MLIKMNGIQWINKISNDDLDMQILVINTKRRRTTRKSLDYSSYACSLVGIFSLCLFLSGIIRSNACNSSSRGNARMAGNKDNIMKVRDH